MEPIQVVFLIGAAVTLFSAVMVVTRRNLVHSALYLILTLFGVAMLFVLLEATFMAVAQVVIYIGAIAIIIIFGIMVTRDITGKEVKTFNKNAVWAGLLAILICVTLIWSVTQWPAIHDGAPTADTSDHIAQFGEQIVGDYVLAFELSSILLLAALVGAIVIAWPRKTKEED